MGAFCVENCAIGGLRIPGIVYQIEHTEVFCTYLKEINEHCKSKGCYFIFIRIEKLAGKLKLGDWEYTVFYDDSHWEDYGNKILAEEIDQIIFSIKGR